MSIAFSAERRSSQLPGSSASARRMPATAAAAGVYDARRGAEPVATTVTHTAGQTLVDGRAEDDVRRPVAAC
jgi:hypothetical protein